MKASSRHKIKKKIKFANLELRVSTQQYIKSLQVILVGEDLNYAIHQVELGQLIFAIHNLFKKIIEEKESSICIGSETFLATKNRFIKK